MAIKREFTYPSGDGRTKIHAVEWKPEKGRPQAVLQIFHGMVEYVERYEDFAAYLAEKGFLVIGNDHLGHGASVVSKEDWGYFAEENGNEILLKDVRSLHKRTAKRYPELPYFILGHSMGSFLLRQYICRWGGELDGTIIMGTGMQPLPALRFGQKLCRTAAKFRGWRYRWRFVDKLAFGSYHKHFPNARTKRDWLTKDPKVIDAYLGDERCCFLFTLNGYYNLFRSIEDAENPERLRQMPKDLPVLFVSGAEDPVGNFGKGVEQVRKLFEAVGMTDVTWILYENDRHEILNETDRASVYRDLYAWLYVRMSDPHRKKGGKEK